MVGRVGFEPTTNSLKGYCSTVELPPRYSFNLPEICWQSMSFFKNLPQTRIVSAVNHWQRPYHITLHLEAASLLNFLFAHGRIFCLWTHHRSHCLS